MMSSAITFLIDRFNETPTNEAIIWNARPYNYEWLSRQTETARQWLADQGVTPGSVVILEGDFCPASISTLLAAIALNCIVVPLSKGFSQNNPDFEETAEAEFWVKAEGEDQFSLEKLDRSAKHLLYQQLRKREHPGLVLFSSGSTGKSKAALHDLLPLLSKFQIRRNCMRAISFLLFDHIGGFNTLLYELSNGGCLVTVSERSAKAVLESVEKFKVEMLPTSPTFLNLLLLSEAYKSYDLSSLKLISYGTEPMPESTLSRLNQLFPQVTFLQTYGLSELGILRSKSKSSDSLWVKIGGEGFEIRVVDNMLQIKAESAMLGYLNAPSPFTEDGWFVTGDLVEQDGEYFRIKGRASEIINIGGQKVYPVEVESTIQEMDNVAEALVYAESNAITGKIVCAAVRLVEAETLSQFRVRLKQFCSQRLDSYKVPVKVQISTAALHSERLKKLRKNHPSPSQ